MTVKNRTKKERKTDMLESMLYSAAFAFQRKDESRREKLTWRLAWDNVVGYYLSNTEELGDFDLEEKWETVLSEVRGGKND